MLLNLASDIPFVYYNKKYYFFDRKSLENDLPAFFVKNKTIQIYVITGPGYFSSSRIWVEVVNIISFIWLFSNIFYINKITLFQNYIKKKNINEIILFSWNKNKFIKLYHNSYDFVWKIDWLSEEFFDSKFVNKKFISYEKILYNYKSEYNRNKSKYIKPYYIFEPIVS